MSKNTVCFDFGDNLIKIVIGAGHSIKKAATVEVPEHAIENGVIQFPEEVAALVKESARQGGFLGDAAVLLPPDSVLVRNVTLPVMDHKQVMYNLPYEFADFINGDESKYFYDYMVLGSVPGEENEADEMRLFACAAEKKTIQTYKDFFHMAGMKLKAAVPEEYAYSRLLKDTDHDKLRDDVCIADIGYTATRLYIYRGAEYLQRRNSDLAFAELEKRIANDRNVDIHLAHTYLMSNFEGILDSPLCLDFCNELAVEVMKTVNFFNYNNRDGDLRRLYLTGGGAAVPQMAESIRVMTGLEVVPISALYGGGEGQETYAGALGCGL